MTMFKRMASAAGLVIWAVLPVVAEKPASQRAVDQVLFDALRNDRIYPRMECIALHQEDSTPGWVYFAVREKHDEKCGGDPNVMPIVDRFRVMEKGQTIEHYDPLEGEYSSYSDFRQRHTKP